MRHYIAGIWNSHTSIGNILGAMLAAAAVRQSNWGNAFIINGVLTIAVGVIVHAFLVVQPEVGTTESSSTPA